MMVSSVHPLKALLPILFTESGITVEEQPRINSLSVISIIALQLLRESYTAFPSATFIFLMPEQSVKAVQWILDTDLGMASSVIFLHLWKAKAPIISTESGKTI
jgi:hypothetical protein